MNNNSNIYDQLSKIILHFDKCTYEHSQRVSKYVEVFANAFAEIHPEYRLSQEKIENIVNAAKIHDIGKIFRDIDILNKKEKLSMDELKYLKQHPLYGAQLLERVRDRFSDENSYNTTYNIVLDHHEKIDGTGYPNGISNVPIEAQIVSICDIYDALKSERPYKEELSNEEVYAIIQSNKCGMFSNDILRIFTLLLESDYSKKDTKSRCA